MRRNAALQISVGVGLLYVAGMGLFMLMLVSLATSGAEAAKARPKLTGRVLNKAGEPARDAIVGHLQSDHVRVLVPKGAAPVEFTRRPRGR